MSTNEEMLIYSICRVTGTLTCLGVAAYSFHEYTKVPRVQVGQRRWLAVFGTAWIGAAFARALYKAN
ncbi:hypothetical protein THRCLA_21960 [Thraustotheca clavata]|uniref:Uncharacterized protein n=1 Tax=Thraustotheca clavata TaxID=74557 RepID=A0A1V9ZH17_9STRA|nr:hypothetical protein THRCLA_21960 [Thraustotheca clavata]